jgi:hypothetical protein
MKRTHLQICLFLVFLFTASMGFARDYIIYSIAQDIPMGHDNEIIQKNYYVNMGEKQGLEKGTILDVFRIISRLDPYETKKRYNYRVKIGELEVLHTEDDSAITNLKSVDGNQEKGLFFDVQGMMIGDHIGVKVN